jgi:tight adherence protein B
MRSVYIVVFYVVVFFGAIFVADAIVGFIRQAAGRDDAAVGRRLRQTGRKSEEIGQQYDLVRNRARTQAWVGFLPFTDELGVLIIQSGLKIDTARVLILMCIISLFAFIGMCFLIPIRFAWASLVLAAFIGAMPVIGYILRARAGRLRLFDEQLPEAIDLVVRSLRVGHPFSGAMQVIARDMPAPIGEEFAIACEQINYGRDAASTISEMRSRLGGASDLGYVAIAVQIQQETGGNLAESLAKLGNVIRERFRMFRKVRAITAEGRFSAWMLSLFPLAIAGAITLVKPNYYSQVADFQYFPHLVALVVILLVINVVAMRILTTLKV